MLCSQGLLLSASPVWRQQEVLGTGLRLSSLGASIYNHTKPSCPIPALHFLQILFYLFTYLFLFNVYGCYSYMYLYHEHAWCPQRPEEGAGCPGAGVTDTSELPGVDSRSCTQILLRTVMILNLVAWVSVSHVQNETRNSRASSASMRAV